jgi:predicted aldo/keto reductase-like oxidoreductase
MSRDRISRRKFVRNTSITAAGVAAGLAATNAGGELSADVKKDIRSYNPEMEYRRLGKTEMMLSAVSLGGHWKQIDSAIGIELPQGHWLKVNIDDPAFVKNRREVVSACIDCGINYVDACTEPEIMAHAEALRGRRDKMHLGFSYWEHDMRFPEWQKTDKLLESLDDLMRRAKLDYVDLWRPTCYWTAEQSHTSGEEQEMIAAFEKAKKAGKVRFTGLSTHKHDWAVRMIQTYPEFIQAVVVPYTAASKKAHARVEPGKGGWVGVPEKSDPHKTNLLSLIDAVKKNDVGWIGIKPFASGSVFKSRGVANSQTKQEDHDRARMTLRHVLANDALTATIPGMITAEQVRNNALAVGERRQFDMAESAEYQEIVRDMWDNLPDDYRWLKDWEYV